MTTEIFQQVR